MPFELPNSITFTQKLDRVQVPGRRGMRKAGDTEHITDMTMAVHVRGSVALATWQRTVAYSGDLFTTGPRTAERITHHYSLPSLPGR